MRVIVFLIIASCYASTYAQSIHARTDEGRDVTLKSDGSWEYVPRSSNKFPVGKEYLDRKKHLSLTLPAAWHKMDKPLVENAQLSFEREDRTIYGMAMIEEIPLTYEDVLGYLRAQTDSSVVQIIGEEMRDFNGIPMHLVVANMKHDGLNFKYHMLVYTGDNWYVKLSTWTFKSVADKLSEDQLFEYFKGLRILTP